MTGNIRDRGSNVSHETRRARLLATLLAKKSCLFLFTPILDVSTYKRLVFLVGFVLRPI